MAGPGGTGRGGESQILLRVTPPPSASFGALPPERRSARHGFMAACCSRPSTSWRPVSVRYWRWGPESSPASLLVAGSRRSCEPHGRQRLRRDQREVLPNEGGRGEIMRGSCRSREGMRETPRRCLKSCPGPRLAVAGNSPTAPCSSGPASEAREQPAGGAGRLERPCRR